MPSSQIQSAIDSLQDSASADHTVFIFPGTYTEQVTIPAMKGKLTIAGWTSNTLSADANTVTIQSGAFEARNPSVSSPTADESTATVINRAARSALYNLNIRNTHGGDEQAVALAALNDRQGYYGLGVFGRSNTLLAQTGAQLYARCTIQGVNDFIYGQHARVLISQAAVAVAGTGGGSITASGRADSADPGMMVLDRCSVQAAAGSNVASQSVFLGQPWGPWARVTVQKSELGGLIAPAGWTSWSQGGSNTQHAAFDEVDNTGPGASGYRAVFASRLAVAVTPEAVLGGDYKDWTDQYYYSPGS